MNITDAVGGYQFKLSGHDFYAGLFDINNPSHPDILQPKLLKKDGSDWKVIKEYDVLWLDVQEDIYPNPEDMAVSIVNSFNKELLKYTDGGELTWNQKLTAIFSLRLVLVGNEIVITGV